MRALALTLLVALALPACATRSVNQTVVNTYDLEVMLRSEKPAFGFKTLPRGYAQPVEISAARLQAILGGIQIDLRPSEKSAIRERRYAIPRKILSNVAEGLSTGLAEAGPDQQIVVLALRKQMQKGFFNRKYLTSFVAWVEGDQLVVQLSRIDWKTDQHRIGDKLPTPRVGEFVMPFTTVGNELYATAGRQGVEVDWRNREFGGKTIEENVAGRRTGAAPIAAPAEPAEQSDASAGAAAASSEGAAAEAAATGGAATDVAAPAASSGAGAAPAAVTGAGAAPAAVTGAGAAPAAVTGEGVAAAAAASASAPAAAAEAPSQPDALRGLDADDLRGLADLEEARAAGRLDAASYEQQRRAILEGER